MSHDDFQVEPVKGLPEPLPEGEKMLWQGRPDWLALSKDALRVHWVLGYFVFLAAWRFVSLIDIVPLGQALFATIPMLIMGLVAAGILAFFATMMARLTVYTVTDARVVMRIGVLLTLTLNLPYRQIANAMLDLHKNGTGTIAFETTDKTKLSYLVLWPHMRPWHLARTQPALRCIPDAQHIADLIADAAEARVSIPQVSRKSTVEPASAVAAE